jgi:uncharacterized protein (DUF2252 family)
MLDIIHRIKRFNRGRDPDRLSLKYEKMRENAFAFLQGTCHLFYDQLPKESIFIHAPVTWLCGDLHVQNFGSYKADNRLVFFDINDFDEALLAPCTWDLVRILVSVTVKAQDAGVKPSQTTALCHAFLEMYRDSLVEGKAFWVERATSEGLVHDLLDGLQRRSRREFLDIRTVHKGKGRKLKVNNDKALPASDKQHERVDSLLRNFAKTQPNPSFFKIIDVARRIAGTASLGLDRYVILVEGNGAPNDNYLLDLKEARPSCLHPHVKIKQPSWPNEACRVEAVQRQMQAVSAAFLKPLMMRGTSYVLRELQPSEDRIAFVSQKTTLRRFEAALRIMGRVVAWGQLRSGGRQGSATIDELIDFGREEKWKIHLLEVVQYCSEHVKSDWRTYVKAFDGGAFAVPD